MNRNCGPVMWTSSHGHLYTVKCPVLNLNREEGTDCSPCCGGGKVSVVVEGKVLAGVT